MLRREYDKIILRIKNTKINLSLINLLNKKLIKL